MAHCCVHWTHAHDGMLQALVKTLIMAAPNDLLQLFVDRLGVAWNALVIVSSLKVIPKVKTSR
ncbi:unnamed protein product [Sphenostylis stenocarpa]|uniref:Uncharacterized protein n=1 Tax=Sphenostylis stenocarpa TaxID=92480 RepID=A0AA86S1V4_9FABA|nr:unnamed protein product [Sphenostylis stenocarpa]